ncbi:MAG: Crp/Fnr family transcriptional regulator [Bacteroidaceae bacterium]|nr:Crp/Fnr family transcriptional regulator [Bacteroidaceae bacterium]
MTHFRRIFADELDPMEQTMFDTLLALPLFQGLGHADLTRILESTRLEFDTVQEDTVVLGQNEVCTGLTFILDGRMKMERFSADGRWSVEEELPIPAVIGVDVLYGSTRTYRHNYHTTRPSKLLRIDKRTIAALTSYFEVFRLNVLNLLTTTIARKDVAGWLPPAMTLEGRIVSFFRMHVERPAGHKRFNISQRTLGHYLGEDARYISKAIQNLASGKVINAGRKYIEIPNFEQLLQFRSAL